MGKAAAVDVERGEDFENVGHRELPVDGPEDDSQVFLAGLQPVQDAIEQERFVLEALRQKAVVAAVKLDPEFPALKVLQPAGPEIARPMMLDPLADGPLTQIRAAALEAQANAKPI